MLKSETSANRNEHQNRKTEVFWHKNRKTDLKNSQNRKTENPNVPLRQPSVSIFGILRYFLLFSLYPVWIKLVTMS